MKFLLIEDDKELSTSLQKVLSSYLYLVDIAADGEIGYDLAESFSYDLILLDWMLPTLSGLEVCQQLRKKGNRTPIILISARDSKTDRVAGLDAGADDYLVKPFETEELFARIRAALRRADGNASPILQWGDLRIDPITHGVSYGDRSIPLTPKEYGLLELFVRSPSRIFSLEHLLDKGWDYTDAPYVGAVRTHVKGLRRKLKTVGIEDVVETVYGLGYRLTVNPPYLCEKAGEKTGEKTGNVLKPYNLLSDNLSELWQTVQPSYLQRVENIAKALREFSLGVPSEAAREHIAAEVHTLTGSLGCFGFLDVTAQCQAIEQLLSIKPHLSDQDIRQLIALTTQLPKKISQPPAAISISAADAADVPRERVTLTPDTSSAAKLLIVDDDPTMLALLRQILQPWGFELELLDSPQNFWERLVQFVPDLIILDVEMPKVSGLELCQALRNSPRWCDVPILFLSTHSSPTTIQRVFSVKADDYLRKPVMASELVVRILSWVERSRVRKLRSSVDSLTGLANQHQASQMLSRLLRLAHRQHKSLCFALISFDNFEHFTERYGQAASDRWLQQLGEFLQSIFRDEDVVCRWCSKSFAVGLYGIGFPEANQRLAKLLKDWEILTIDEDISLTLSAGIALQSDDTTDLQFLSQKAQELLNQVQQSGGNSVLSSASVKMPLQDSPIAYRNE